MYISGRPSHFTAKRNIAFTIYHHLPRIFFFKIQSSIDPSVSSSSEKKKKSFQPYEPIAILALKHSHSRSYMLFLFVSRVCSMVMPFFILLCLSCRYHHVSAREMIKEAMRSWKKKKRKRKKKDTSSTFRWKRNRMERNNGDRDDRLFRRFFHHRLVIVTAANNFVARSSSQRWAILLRLSHYFFFFPPPSL